MMVVKLGRLTKGPLIIGKAEVGDTTEERNRVRLLVL